MIGKSSRSAPFMPDYGAHLYRSGRTGIDIEFGSLIDHVAFLNDSMIAVTGTTVDKGIEYAVTFNIPRRLFPQLFANAPDYTLDFLTRILRPAHDFPFIVVLPQPFAASFRTRLGDPVEGLFEGFIPLVVWEVL